MNYIELFEKAKAAGIESIEVYEEKTKGLEINVFNRRVEKNVASQTLGVAVRGSYKGKMGYVAVENTSDDRIDFIVNALKENASLLSKKEPSTIFKGSDRYESLPEVSTAFTEIDPKEKIDLLLRLEDKLLAGDPRIVSVDDCTYEEVIVEKHLMNSKGLNLTKKSARVIVVGSVVAKEGEDVKSHYDYVITQDPLSIDLDILAKSIVEKAVSKLHAASLPSKKYPVVFGNRVFSSLLSAFTPMFSGEAVIKGTSPLINKEGECIVGENITIVNDPLYDQAITRASFDDEGVACQKTVLIENGVFKSFLHNISTAQKCNATSTGNGFKPSLISPVGVSVYNFYLQPGKETEEELFKDANEGVYITSLQGLHSGVNAITGDFSLQASGYYLKDGKIERPVTLIVVSGNILELLSQVEGLGNDLFFNFGRVGTPSIRVKELSISGE